MNQKEIVGSQLKKARKLCNLSQGELAEKVGISRNGGCISGCNASINQSP